MWPRDRYIHNIVSITELEIYLRIYSTSKIRVLSILCQYTAQNSPSSPSSSIQYHTNLHNPTLFRPTTIIVVCYTTTLLIASAIIRHASIIAGR